MSYNILRTDKANDQLFDVIQYIADNAGANIALQYLDKLEAAVSRVFARKGEKIVEQNIFVMLRRIRKRTTAKQET